MKLSKTAIKNENNLYFTSRKIGYARVSTGEQRIDLQLHALKQAGCDEIFIDEGVSGAKADRIGLLKAMASLQSGDTLVVWRLDRLGRSLINLVSLMSELGSRGIEFHSVMENIDTSSAGGRLVFHLMAALAEFERSLISERTRAGMEAARLRGRRLGRPGLVKPAQKAEIIATIQENASSIDDVARRYKISPRAVRAIVKQGVLSP